MILKGQKRKLPPEEMEVSVWSSPAWERQREFVFSVSMNKYRRSQELAEPSLRRSVLIANTLRQISLEACSAPSEDVEAVQPPCGVKHPALTSCPVVSADYVPSPVPARLPVSAHTAEPDVPMSVENEDEDWGSMPTETDSSLSAAISSILTALDSTIDGGSQAAPRTPLRSLENLSGSSEGGVAWTKPGIKGHGVTCDQQGEGRIREGCVEAKSSYLSDITVEDLFQDIDTSMLERDMGVLGLFSSGGGTPAGEDLLRYLPPFSPSSSSSQPFPLSLNQSLKCLPSFSSFSSLSPPPAPPLPASASFPNQSTLREGLELDHLMEILVES